MTCIVHQIYVVAWFGGFFRNLFLKNPLVLVIMNVWQPGGCRWLGISWYKVIWSSEFDVVPSHLQHLVTMLYWAMPFWGLWMIGSLVGTDDLAYLDARPSAALSWTWWQAIHKPRLLYCIGPDILRVVNVWLPGRCRWLGIFDARPSPAMNLLCCQATYNLWLIRLFVNHK